MLVGGLSKSEYAYDRIHDGYAAKRMKVCRAEDAWTAVSQGARYTVSRLALYIRDCLDGIMAFSIVSVVGAEGHDIALFLEDFVVAGRALQGRD